MRRANVLVENIGSLNRMYTYVSAQPALRILFAAHPQLLSGVLHIIHCVIGAFLVKQAGLKSGEADTGAVTLIQRFGSTANLNIHLTEV